MQRRLTMFVLLIAAAIGLLYTLLQQDPDAVLSQASNAPMPRYTMFDAEWTRYDVDGQPSLLGQASKVTYFDDQSGRADELIVDALGVGGAPWRLSAPDALMPARQRKFELQGPVDIAGKWPDNGEAVRARTDHVWIDPDVHQFSTDAFVEWDSATRSGTSVGLQSNWQYRTLDLLHNVNMIYRDNVSSVSAKNPASRP